MKKETIIKKAKEYVEAKADYNGNGFDVFCECYGTEEWEEFIEDAWGWRETKAMINTIASIHADRQADAVNSAF